MALFCSESTLDRIMSPFSQHSCNMGQISINVVSTPSCISSPKLDMKSTLEIILQMEIREKNSLIPIFSGFVGFKLSFYHICDMREISNL